MSIGVDSLFKYFQKKNINFYTGVPDSLLKSISYYLSENTNDENHIIAANEGNAIAIAAGYHLATKKIPFVYMQNSGFGNAINPILSLAEKEVYSIPMIVMIGWRGEPGMKDAIQHSKDGQTQEKLLKALDIPYQIIDENDEDFEKFDYLMNIAKNEKCPVIFLMKKNSIKNYSSSIHPPKISNLNREAALESVLSELPSTFYTVCSTGKISREVYEIREKNSQNHSNDFLNVGAMGHSSSLAFGIALKSNKKILCIDGDGSLIMHLGALSTVAKIIPNNFYYLLINNFSHESVGGQETAAEHIDFEMLSKAFKFNRYFFSDSNASLIGNTKSFLNSPYSFFEIRVNQGSRNDLGRPSLKLSNMKKIYMDSLNEID